VHVQEKEEAHTHVELTSSYEPVNFNYYMLGEFNLRTDNGQPPGRW
jgi:hypothetical protein